MHYLVVRPKADGDKSGYQVQLLTTDNHKYAAKTIAKANAQYTDGFVNNVFRYLVGVQGVGKTAQDIAQAAYPRVKPADRGKVHAEATEFVNGKVASNFT